jgi:transaldolase
LASRSHPRNPAIFQKAIEGSNDYVSAIAELAKTSALSAKGIYEGLAIKDTADVLRPVHDRTKALDGYVSLEV